MDRLLFESEQSFAYGTCPSENQPHSQNTKLRRRFTDRRSNRNDYPTASFDVDCFPIKIRSSIDGRRKVAPGICVRRTGTISSTEKSKLVRDEARLYSSHCQIRRDCAQEKRGGTYGRRGMYREAVQRINGGKENEMKYARAYRVQLQLHNFATRSCQHSCANPLPIDAPLSVLSRANPTTLRSSPSVSVALFRLDRPNSLTSSVWGTSSEKSCGLRVLFRCSQLLRSAHASIVEVIPTFEIVSKIRITVRRTDPSEAARRE